jgi:hypothetical protein
MLSRILATVVAIASRCLSSTGKKEVDGQEEKR